LSFEKAKNTHFKAWSTLSSMKLNNNWTQYSSTEIYWQCSQGTEPELY